ncbi:MAG: hypothetical protein KBC32_03895, partial [Candidatus Didemnitutus sp.]|nr:hypothetical protein [Candidatus Didemnitutus sp.]
LHASGVSSDLVIAAGVRSGSGSVTLLGARDVRLETGAAVQTAGVGTLDVEAVTGSLVMVDNVPVLTAGGNIRLWAAVDVTLSGVSAGAGSVTVRAVTGSIHDAGATLLDVQASALRMMAAVGIGAADALDTAVTTLAAAATTGGIRVTDVDALTLDTVAVVSVSRVSLAATVNALADSAATSDVTATSGAIELTTLAGSLTLNDGVNADARAIVTTTGAITLTAAQDIVFAASVVSASGNLTLTAQTGAMIDATVGEGALLVTTGDATLTAATGIGAAGALDLDTTLGRVTATNTLSGGLFLHETDTLTVLGLATLAGDGPVSLLVDLGDVTLAGAVIAHGAGNLFIRAAAGSLTVEAPVESTSGHLTLRAAQTLHLAADVATGGAGTVNFEANLITATLTSDVTTATGDIRFASATDIVLGGVITTQ